MIEWMAVRLQNEKTGLSWFVVFYLVLYWPMAYSFEYGMIGLFYFIEFCCDPMRYLWRLWIWNEMTFPISLFLVGYAALLAKDWVWKKIKTLA